MCYSQVIAYHSVYKLANNITILTINNWQINNIIMLNICNNSKKIKSLKLFSFVNNIGTVLYAKDLHNDRKFIREKLVL